MNKKIAMYALLPVIGAGAFGIHSASAWFGNANPDQVAQRQQGMFQNESQALGISIDEVKSAWAQGKSMQQLMQEKNISKEDVRTRMKAQRDAQMKERLQILVSKGVITQAQADQRVQVMQTRIEHGKGPGIMGFFRSRTTKNN
jgi:hypothetical protein